VVNNPFSNAINPVDKNNILIFPNPCHDEVMIVADIETDVDILNIQGQGIRTIPANALQMPVQVGDLVPGIYFLRFKNTDGLAKLIVH